MSARAGVTYWAGDAYVFDPTSGEYVPAHHGGQDDYAYRGGAR